MYNICKFNILILFCFSFCDEVFEVFCVCVFFIWNYKYRKCEMNFVEWFGYDECLDLWFVVWNIGNEIWGLNFKELMIKLRYSIC